MQKISDFSETFRKILYFQWIDSCLENSVIYGRLDSAPYLPKKGNKIKTYFGAFS